MAVPEGSSVDIDVAANDTGAASVVVARQPDAGIVMAMSGTTLRYIPPLHFFGQTDFTYEATSTDGMTATADVTVTVDPLPDPPAASLDDALTDEDTPVVIDVLANDTDPDGDPLTILSAASTDGIATTDGSTITYTPDPDTNGTHALVYTVGDTTGLTDSAAVVVTVNPLPDAPVANGDVAILDEDSSVAIAVLANDTDPDGDPLTILSAASTDGVATTDGSTITYTPDPDRNGTHALVYTVGDGTGLTDSAAVVVTVNPLPDAPVANGDVAIVDEDSSVVIAVLANDTDPDGDPLTISGASSIDGTPTTDGSTITYTPAPNSSGTHLVSYTINDGTGRTDSASITIQVNPLPDPPSAVDDVAVVDEDDTVVISPLTNDSDLDGDPLTVIGASSPDGTATTDGTTITYTPDPDTNGTHTIDYTIDDGTGRTGTATITVTVSPLPDPPVAGDDTASVDEDGIVTVFVLLDDSDPDGDPLTVIEATSTDGAAITDGTTVTYTPAPDSNGTHTVDYKIDDGTGRTADATITVTVNPLPDDPVAADDTATTDEDVAVVISPLDNDSDPDSDPLTVTAATAEDGTATTDGTTITYTPDPDANGTHTIDYTIDDGTGRTDTATITVAVNPVPDPPRATDDAYATDENVTLVVSAPGVLANDSEEDGDPLSATETVAPTDGTLTLNPDGSFTYVPDPGFSGTDQFEYEADDGIDGTSTATVTILVSSTSVQNRYYFDTTGPWSWEWDLTTAAPANADPEPDHDGDGNPGLTIKKSSQSLFELNTDKFQLWSLPVSAPLVLDGPVTLDLWSTTKDFETNKDVDYSIWLFDCDATRLFCNPLATAHDVHVDDWNGGVADWVNKRLVIGSVDHTVAPGRVLLVRLMFGHRDVWLASSGNRPTSLEITQ